jgi:hypothetical protein
MGGSTEQGNARICGTLYPCNVPETNVTVQLVPEHYNPFDSSTGVVFKTLTDINGNYIFENIPYGTYYLYAFDNDKSITLLNGPIEIVLDQNDFRNDSLRRSSSVCIFSGGKDMTLSKLFFVKGTSATDFYLQDSIIKLTKVPSGRHDIVQYDSVLKTIGKFTDNVDIFPDDSITVGLNNRPPRVITEPSELPSELIFDSTYSKELEVSDPESDSVTFSRLTQGLTYTIDPSTGYLKWVPHSIDQDVKSITIKVTDSRGASSTFTWNFHFNRTAPPTPSSSTWGN